VSDQLHTFLFERLAARGTIVQLELAWQEILAIRTYPAPLRTLIGQAIVSVALLASTIKSGNALLLQIQGQGPGRLLVAECFDNFALRCTARWSDEMSHAPLGELFSEGRCAMTLKGADGGALYQGIVPLDAPTLAAALEAYMRQSEQLETRFWLFADAASACGLMLQRVPDKPDSDPDAFHRICTLANTVSGAELTTLSAPELLRRLFHEDDVRLFGARPLHNRCTCNRARVQTMLRMLGQREIEQLLHEQGKVEVRCDFCARPYAFNTAECRELFAPGRSS
jgi:molecular chaperone Hsp33